jgi:hypothetical protein
VRNGCQAGVKQFGRQGAEDHFSLALAEVTDGMETMHSNELQAMKQEIHTKMGETM